MTEISNQASRINRVVILGLDGGTLDAVKPWAEKGLLPHFARLLSTGAWGVLRSTYPPLTMPAWLSFSTGKSPGRLGIYGFVTLLDGSYEFQISTHYHTRGHKELWDLLNEHGYTCGILNNPLMDRPIAIDGFCVPGFMASESDYRTSPVELRSELDEVVGGYELEVRGHYLIDPKRLLEECLRVMDKRVEAILHLLNNRPVDLLLAVITMTDRMLHCLYNTHAPGCFGNDRPGDNMLVDFFQALDTAVGRICDQLDEDDLLLIISDHGFKRADRLFFLNNWLMDQGWLSWKGEKWSHRVGFTQKGLARFLVRQNLYSWGQRIVPTALRNRIPVGHKSGEGVSIVEAIQNSSIEWRSTRVVAIGSGSDAAIYFNTEDRPQGTVGIEDIKGDKEVLISELLKVRDPQSGAGLGINVHEPQELYLTEEPINSPDFCIDLDGDILPSTHLSIKGALFGKTSRAQHSIEGMFMAHHPMVLPGEVKGLSIMDIMPTILSLFSIPPPEGIDGVVIRDIFKNGVSFLDRGPGGESAKLVLTAEKKRIASIARKLRAQLDHEPGRD